MSDKNKDKEVRIQQCQNWLSNIELVKSGLLGMVDMVPVPFELNDLYISPSLEYDCYYENFAAGLKDEIIEDELKRAHKKYVALLDEMRLRKSEELNYLLKQK